MADTQSGSTQRLGHAILSSPKVKQALYKTIELVVMFVVAIGIGWLYFLPQFWYMVSSGATLESGIYEIFFSRSDNSQTLGGGVDQIGTVWIFHVVDQIQSGEMHTKLDHIFYPIGFDLGKNTGFAWADATISKPLIKYFGTPGFYNLHILSTLVLTQVSIAVLCRTAGAPLLVAIGLGALGVCQPFVIAEIYQGRPTQAYWLFHALFLISTLKLSKGRKPILWGSIGGISLAGSCLTYWFGGAAVGFCGGIVLLLQWLLSKRRLQLFSGGLVMAASTLLVALPLTWRVSGEILKGKGGDHFTALKPRANRETMDILGWDLPIDSIRTIQSSSDWSALMDSIQIGTPILWIAGLSLAIPFGLKKKWAWGVGFIAALSIPMGSSIVWKGTWLPTGYAWLHSVFPPLARCTLPHRMIPAAIIIGLLLGAITLSAILKKTPRGWIRQSLSLTIGCALLFLAISQAPTQKESRKGRFGPDVELLEATQKEEWVGGIIDVPLMNSEKSYVQTVYHKQPILGGPGLINVRPFEHQRYCNRNSLLRRLEVMAEKGKLGSFKEKDRQKLIDDGFSLIVVDLNKSKAEASAYIDLLGTRYWHKERSNRLFIGLK